MSQPSETIAALSPPPFLFLFLLCYFFLIFTSIPRLSFFAFFGLPLFAFFLLLSFVSFFFSIELLLVLDSLNVNLKVLRLVRREVLAIGVLAASHQRVVGAGQLLHRHVLELPRARGLLMTTLGTIPAEWDIGIHRGRRLRLRLQH